MISYGKQSIDQSDIDAVVEVLKSSWLTQGPTIELFESKLNKYFGSSYSTVVSNGTAALHLTGLALGWGENDIVITTPLTFLATANSIIYCNAIPDFVDINQDSYTIDPQKLEERIKNHQKEGRKVKAVIGVDYSGHPCDWKSLRQLADKYEFKLVNDNCHALGAEYFGDKRYAVKYADVATQSYHPVKHITTGEGGSILTNNLDLDIKLKTFRTHGMTRDSNLLSKNDGPWYYEMQELGFNYRMTDFQAALGVSQLKKLDYFILERRKISQKYDQLFEGLENVILPKRNKSINHGFHLYPLQIDFDKLSLSKKDLFFKMKNRGIALQVHYIPIHLQPFYMKKYGFKFGDFPIVESFYKKEISLPIYPGLTEHQVEKVSSAIIEFLV